MSARRLVKSMLAGAVGLATAPLGKGGRRRLLGVMRVGMKIAGYDETVIEIVTPGGTVRFYCLGDLPRWRAETLLTKEPETIDWLDGLDTADVLYDVGANIGAYTLYAAAAKGARVLAFEPLPSNYYLLNRNIEENDLAHRVTAYCLAFSDDDQLGVFHAQDTAFGAALSSFGEALEQAGQTHASDFEQGMIGMRLDRFIDAYAPPFPTHIKIDVDGNEEQIVKGAEKTLSDPRLKSVSVELDDTRGAERDRVVALVEDAGLTFTAKRRAAIFDNTPAASTYNFHFHRKPSGPGI